MSATRDTRVLHTGRRFTFVEVEATLPDGRVVRNDIVRHPGAVAILPVLDGPRGREIVFVRNFRPTVDASILELPAGTLESGEDPADCALRELAEETGYRASVIRPLGTFWTTPGLTDEVMHSYVATNLEHVGQSLDDGEHIDVETYPLTDVPGMLDRGDIRDGKSMVILMHAIQRGIFDGLAPNGGSA